MSLFSELRRRNVFRVAMAYAVVAWLLIQIVTAVEAPLGLPPWFDTAVIVLLVLGFPIAALFAWAYELTPAGIRPTASVDADESITRETGQKLNRLIITVLSAAVVLLLVLNLVPDSADDTGRQATAAGNEAVQSGAGAVRPVPGVAALPNSIAVLPFENLSPVEEDAYFAIGLHDEILNQLSKLSRLNVIARTTMGRYARTSKSMEEIASELNVATVMEGTVRYADGQVRITTQLIDGAAGTHLWSETYTRPFEDIFTIESDIAMNVANAMRVEFSLEEQNSIEEIPTVSQEAYSLYLSANGLNTQIGFQSYALAISQIDRVTELAPEFVDGWILKALIYESAVVFGSFDNPGIDYGALAEEYVRRAMDLAPEDRRVYEVQSVILANRGEWIAARQVWDRAAELGARRDALGTLPLLTGDTELAHAHLIERRNLDPLWSVVLSNFLIQLEFARGNPDGARFEFERGLRLIPDFGVAWNEYFLELLAAGELERAREMLEDPDMGLPPSFAEFGRAYMGLLDEPVELSAFVREIYENSAGPVGLAAAARLAAIAGENEISVEALRRSLGPLGSNILSAWRSYFAPARQTESFKALMRDVGLVDYWREYGWTDFCEPVGDDDFRCF